MAAVPSSSRTSMVTPPVSMVILVMTPVRLAVWAVASIFSTSL